MKGSLRTCIMFAHIFLIVCATTSLTACYSCNQKKKQLEAARIEKQRLEAEKLQQAAAKLNSSPESTSPNDDSVTVAESSDQAIAGGDELQVLPITSGGDTMVELPSGLKYIVIKDPREDARSPQKGNVVKVHYTGWLFDEQAPDSKGVEFDSSHKRNEPFRFIIGAGQVIQGWDEGVMSMKVGELRRLIIPANLGYGTRGAGNLIPSNATLVFDVELLDVN